ncbi:ABC transporter ATP-binding protein [Actinobacteria bacterium YIM 96077]|uniref:Fe(3+)-dicitrate ABC transporter ATP-binding protein n=1 Tax=Phytoactinopolyspora halophila TaxID=1981511 RepID=A0A329R687_9ACTN|nr:ABC transporter ATP-binding protein [Phytoactinopolyspora halophila]AYY15252.1 ABC transporter ATP-binding protein [Actinobacteria bacterium YIM 96077]RAW18952.1 Fe(3+)-dicitrate ABC transporter ATP-binding protein [Phytoactinopolyspora halophila]
MTPMLGARNVTLAYDAQPVVAELNFDVPEAQFTVIVGPNACGKSTLLKALARTLRPVSGEVLLDGRPISSYRSKAVARRVAMLPQSPIAPEAISVRDLVGRGRYPHQSLLRQWTDADAEAVRDALHLTGISDLAGRQLTELSGGQRQRAWLAMVLAQQTELLLLDEPTTFLDIAHQYEVLDLCEKLHAAGRSVVAVLHDLNQAVRYATHLVCMKDGQILAQGPPDEIMTSDVVRATFGIDCRIITDPESDAPLVVRKRTPLP